jgi:D-amino-acid oxidase
VTLSWGTAELAVAEVLKTRAKRVAVLGCGAVGLATARLLQTAGVQTNIYAKEFPPNTLSDVAGARWYPFV